LLVCLLPFFVLAHFVFGLFPFLKKWGGGEIQEIRMKLLSFILI
jgi:hypothetical protein